MDERPSPDVVAFWSYSHADETSDKRILSLANDIRAEFSLLTGQELQIFVDRSSLEWGDRWRRQIDNALGSSAFFIPVITPRYFTRPECRSELLRYNAASFTHGYERLLLPIYYAPVDQFGDDLHPDEAIALIARTQWTDWTQLRLSDTGSQEYRRSVNEIAQKLKTAFAEVQESRLRTEFSAASDDLGFAEHLEGVESHLSDLLPAVLTDQTAIAQFEAIGTAHLARYERLKAQHAPAGAKFAVIQRWAVDIMPLCQRHFRDAQEYSRLCVEMDSLVIVVIDSAGRRPDLRVERSIISKQQWPRQ